MNTSKPNRPSDPAIWGTLGDGLSSSLSLELSRSMSAWPACPAQTAQSQNQAREENHLSDRDEVPQNESYAE